MIKTNCSKCKKFIEDDNVFQDYNLEYYCKKCYLKDKLANITQEYNEKEQWLRNTHLKHLEELQKKMNVLKTEISKI